MSSDLKTDGLDADWGMRADYVLTETLCLSNFVLINRWTEGNVLNKSYTQYELTDK